MELDGIEVYVKVVQAGSFSQAAKLLGMPKTTVSAKVAKLEKRLGVTLIQRTTRKLHVTPAGQSYFQRCVRALEEVAAGEAELATANKDPQGLIRVTAGVDAAHSLVGPVVCQFLRKHPKMQVELIVTNRVVDLIGEGIDLAFRAGELEDSSLVARKLVRGDICVWASPAYIKRQGAPSHPSELRRHEWLHFSQLPSKHMVFKRGKEEVDVSLESRLLADEFGTLKALILRGVGIGLLPDFLAEADERAGKLVRVLPKWLLDSGNVSLVYPGQRFLSPKVQAFIAAALEGRDKLE